MCRQMAESEHAKLWKAPMNYLLRVPGHGTSQRGLFVKFWLGVLAETCRWQGSFLVFPDICSSFLGTTCFTGVVRDLQPGFACSLLPQSFLWLFADSLSSDPLFVEPLKIGGVSNSAARFVLSAIAANLHSLVRCHPMGQIHPSISLLILFDSTIFMRKQSLLNVSQRLEKMLTCLAWYPWTCRSLLELICLFSSVSLWETLPLTFFYLFFLVTIIFNLKYGITGLYHCNNFFKILLVKDTRHDEIKLS